MSRIIGTAATPETLAERLDPASHAWLRSLRAQGRQREAAIRRLHAILADEARYEVRHRVAGLEHPSGQDLDDLAVQAADDAIVAILAKLDDFRGEALFTTWARRFVTREVPGKIRRRLGHTREQPSADEPWQRLPGRDDPLVSCQARDFARNLAELIANELTPHQRRVLVALAIGGLTTTELATRLGSSPGALYKTLHDARRKLRAAPCAAEALGCSRSLPAARAVLRPRSEPDRARR